MSLWRVGDRCPHALYRDDEVVGVVETPELAIEIVNAMNRTHNLDTAPPLSPTTYTNELFHRINSDDEEV